MRDQFFQPGAKRPRPLPRHVVHALAVALLMIMGAACTPSIGDECETSADCPTGAICDITVDGGYCTIPDCEQGECPGASICVRFDDETAYCMASCEASDECRDGLSCRVERKAQCIGFCYEGSDADDACD